VKAIRRSFFLCFPCQTLADLVNLVACDGNVVTVERNVACMMGFIKTILEISASSDTDVIPVMITSQELTKIVEYCRFHAEADRPDSGISEDDVRSWDEEYIKMDRESLFQLILSVNYMDVRELLDLACKTVSSMLRGKTPEEIRQEFEIRNDLTPQEEEQIRRENGWLR